MPLMVGSELSSNVDFLLDRAAEELDVASRLQPVAKKLAPVFIRLFGVPEIGLHIRTRAVLRALPQDVGRFCDLGCGAGFLLGAVARAKRVGSLTGVEIDAASAALARELHPRATILNVDVRDVPSGLEGTFDSAASVDVLEHLEQAEIASFLSRARELLVTGGILAIHVPAPNQRRHLRSFDTWSHHDHEREGFTEQELISALSECGFGITHVEGTAGYFGSLAWELNMKVAASAAQAVAFPPLLLLSTLDDIVKSKRYNGLLVTATKL